MRAIVLRRLVAELEQRRNRPSGETRILSSRDTRRRRLPRSSVRSESRIVPAVGAFIAACHAGDCADRSPECRRPYGVSVAHDWHPGVRAEECSVGAPTSRPPVDSTSGAPRSRDVSRKSSVGIQSTEFVSIVSRLGSDRIRLPITSTYRPNRVQMSYPCRALRHASWGISPAPCGVPPHRRSTRAFRTS